MKSNNLLEVSIETPKDGNVYFPCAGLSLRGRKDFMRIALHDAEAIKLVNEFPRGVPGTIICIDLDAETVELIEPLRTEDWTPEREKIEKRGIEIPPNVNVEGARLPDWLHEIKRSLDNGHAKITEGKLPDDLGEETKRPASDEDKSGDRIDRLCDLVEKLLTHLVGKK